MKYVALVFQPYISETRRLAEECARFLRQQGFEASVLSAFALEPSMDASGLGLAVALGGDGTTLRAARWLARSQVPIVGVAMGRLSFLAELAPSDLPGHLLPYLEGDFWLDERTMLRAQLKDQEWLALNDVVMGRGGAMRAVRLEVHVDSTPLHTFTADGVVLATATGSTAYSMASGGPILAPGLPEILMQMVAPHLAPLDSLLVPQGTTVEVTFRSNIPGLLSIDGQIDVPIHDGETAAITTAPWRTLFARRGRRSDFYRTLVAKLRARE